MLQAVCLVVHLVPAVAHYLDQELLDEAVASYTAGDDRRWDQRLLRWDVIGTMGHIGGLVAAGLLTREEHTVLSCELRRALADADTGTNLKISLAPLRWPSEDLAIQMKNLLTAATGNSGIFVLASFVNPGTDSKMETGI